MSALPYIAAYLLGVLSFGAFMLVMLLRVHRTPPPVLRRRKNRDRLPEVRNVPPMPVCKVAREADFAEVGGISYQWLGVTGSEQE
ncbi:hypothetical protein [Paraburkholderia sp. RL18-085-BIA-A]|uniref:hypothetical protein n=1 Tax=Paraburkholderia sp. RL18-085-BIA-A TaxID=3031633 RepID=UPI0038BD731E